ncbi:MAG: hypothetical protein GY802_29805, partial [Gammaproteobacteria bacterium]|nr:hypothetical protein [Gammaproteobacteria bacterium]
MRSPPGSIGAAVCLILVLLDIGTANAASETGAQLALPSGQELELQRFGASTKS